MSLLGEQAINVSEKDKRSDLGLVASHSEEEMITGTIAHDATGYAQEYLTEVLIELNIEQVFLRLDYYVKVHCSPRTDQPEETPIDRPALMHQHDKHRRFRCVVATENSIVEIFALASSNEEPIAYGLYLVHQGQVAHIEEKGIYLTEDEEGKEALPHVRDILST
jgi:hypothetical protein